MRINGAQPMVTIGDDHLGVALVSYQQQRRKKLACKYFFSVLFHVLITDAQKRQA